MSATTLGAFVYSPFCTDPRPVAHCGCLANQSCATCGWGMGAYPCLCNREAYERRVRDLSPTDGGPRSRKDKPR